MLVSAGVISRAGMPGQSNPVGSLSPALLLNAFVMPFNHDDPLSMYDIVYDDL